MAAAATATPGVCQSTGGAQGYAVTTADGAVYGFGADQSWGSLPSEGVRPAAPIVGMASYGTSGYWLAGADGGVFAIGSCIPFYGSAAGRSLDGPVVGITSARINGRWGYWLVTAAGSVYPFGNARSFGSMAGRHLDARITGIAATYDGQGYWLVGADGGVFSFGDAVFRGSAAGKVSSPVVGIAAHAFSDSGYWLSTAAGAVYAFGTAQYKGSALGLKLAAPIVGLAAAQQIYNCSPAGPGDTTEGYWLLGADGGIFSYGSATFQGSESDSHSSSPFVGIESGPQTPPSCPAQP
jgi:hypothetical protein